MIPMSEIFYSIEGEGVRQGLSVLFVRFSGCNLRCKYCDTKYAQDGLKPEYEVTEKDLINQIEERLKYDNCKRLTFTGGEPMLQERFITGFIKSHPKVEVNIETNGSQEFKNMLQYKNTIVTADIKMPSSGEYNAEHHHRLNDLRSRDVVKAVVEDRNDLNMLTKFLNSYRGKAPVYLHPVWGKTEMTALADYAKDHEVRVGIQLHKIIWEYDKRGV